MYTVLESGIADRIVKYLKKRGGFVLRVHGGPMQRRGIPDILYWERGIPFAFEVKGPSGKVTKIQDATIRQMMDQGGVICAVVRGVPDVEMVLDNPEGAWYPEGEP